MRVVLRNNGNGRKDAAYVVTTEPGADGRPRVVAYYGKWASYTAHGLAGLTSQIKTVSGTSLWLTSFISILGSKLDRGYAPVDGEMLTHRVSMFLLSRGYDLGTPPAQQPAPPAAKPHQPIEFDKLNASLAAEKAPPAPKPVTVTGGLAFAQNLAKMQPAPPAPKPDPAPKPKPARPKTRAAMLEW